MIAALVLVSALDVHYITRVEPRPWQPLQAADVERILEQKTLVELGGEGALRLQRSTFVDLKGGDYALLMEGRFIEDAGKFTVSLTFSAGQKATLPSYYVLDTGEVENRTPAQMQSIIAALATRAGKRLAALLTPHLYAQGNVPAIETEVLPIDFGAIALPTLAHPTGAVFALMNARHEDSVRQEAFLKLEKHVFDQPAARTAVERCAVSDPWPGLRADCVTALAPVARTRLETQRLLLAAMRQEVDGFVLVALVSVSRSFVGLSRKEAVATWLDVLSANGTPADAANAIADILRDEGQVPNLELALTRCLAQETLVEGKRAACCKLLPKLSAPRRVHAVYRYLETVQTAAPDNVMGALESQVWGLGSEPLDPLLADLLLRIAPEPRLQDSLPQLLYALRRFPNPSEQTILQLLHVADTSAWASDALITIQCLVEDTPALRASTLVQLRRLRGHRFMRRSYSSDPQEQLEKVIARLEAKT